MTNANNMQTMQREQARQTDMKQLQTYGIHHVSSIVGHAQKNIDFNAGILGLRLVKKTLNFDDRHGYHFYFGNKDGSTGLTTTFPLTDAQEGKMGGGQVKSIQYAVRPGNLEFWEDRLARFGIVAIQTSGLAGRKLRFKDPTGLNIEILESEKTTDNVWTFDDITEDQAILGIEAVTLLSRHPDQTLDLFTNILGYTLENEDSSLYQLKIHDQLGGHVYLSKEAPKQGNIAIGSVHHVALKARDEDMELWIERLKEAGYHPTEVKQRKYFKAVYFREKGGILIELSSFGPGVLLDETIDNLGQSFLIPRHFAEFEEEIKDELPPIEVRTITKLGSYTYRNPYEYNIVQEREALKKEMEPYREMEAAGTISEADAATLRELRRRFVTMK